jgi:hypothetical protein
MRTPRWCCYCRGELGRDEDGHAHCLKGGTSPTDPGCSTTAELGPVLAELGDRLAALEADREPVLSVPRVRAARMLGMGLTSFERYVRPHIRLVRKGNICLVPVAELDRWVERNAEHGGAVAGQVP